MSTSAKPSVTVSAEPSRRIWRDSPAWSSTTPGPPAARAASSSTRRPSSFVTPGFTPPNTRTALRCWKRLSERGAVVRSILVKVETGTSCPPGVRILRSSSGPRLERFSSPSCGITL